jgi:hypothetical protein
MKVRKLLNVLAVLFVMVGLVAGLTRATASMAAADGTEKIEAMLLDRFAAEGQADFIVRFVEQADLSTASTMTWDDRGEFVVNSLTDVANRSQVNAQAVLDAQGFRFQTFISGNDLYVWAGNQNVATTLAALPEVASIRATRTYSIDPLELTNPLANVAWAGDLLSRNLVSTTGASPNALAWGITYTGADQFWTSFGVQGDGIVVANIDTGVQWNHPALDQSFHCPGDPSNAACWSDPENWCGGSACDNNGHGTHTMGTMVADDDPGLTWQAGMAPNATWIACKGCGTSSCSDLALNACADWILAPGGSSANRPNVVNNSWGGGGGDSWYQVKVQNWVAAGVFPAFSAGNSGSSCSTLGSPGDYQESFGSAAIDSGGTAAGFSSRGPSSFGHDPYTKPNIAAPGVSVCSTIPTNAWSCGYSGTSMASPHTAGAVALLWSCNASLIGDITGTFAALQNSALAAPAGNCGAPPDAQGNYTYGYGYLNVLEAGIAVCGGVSLGSIDGYVEDAGGNPIEGATVTAAPGLDGSQIQATTDPTGYYTMTLVVGTYDVTASMYGYTSATMAGVDVLAGLTTQVDFTLSFLGGWTLVDPAVCFDLTRIGAAYYPVNGMVYILGGRGGASGGDTYGNIYAFDPVSSTCADTGALMPTPISNYSVSVVNDGTNDLLCTFGGRDAAGTMTLNVQCYDPNANTASIVATLPSTFTGFMPGGQAVVDNMVYVFGGFSSTNAPYMLDLTYRFDPTTNLFTQIGNLNLARGYIYNAVVDGMIYAFGGDTWDGTNLVAQTIAEVMADPGGAGTWDDGAVADLAAAYDQGRAFGFDTSSTSSLAGQIILVGGGIWPGESADVWTYNTATDTYDTSFPDLINARRNHAMVYVPICTSDPTDGLPGLYVFGGRQGQDTPPFMPAEFFGFPDDCVTFTIDKTAPGTANNGETFTYNFTLDFGDPIAGTAWMTDTLPAGVEYAGNLTYDFGNAWFDSVDNAVYWEYGYSTFGTPIVVQNPVNPVNTGTPTASIRTSGGTAVAYSGPLAVLYDQTDNPSVNGFSSQDFEPSFDLYDNQGADDFTVPVADGAWSIEQVYVAGSTSLGYIVPFVNVYFYEDNAGLPGTEVYSAYGVVPADDGSGSLTIVLPAAAVLPAGDYWLSVQAAMDFGTYGQWYWTTRSIQTANPWAWQNPGDGFASGCTTWAYGAGYCIPTIPEPDALFRLDGQVVSLNPSVVNIAFDVTVTSTGGTLHNEAFLDYNGVAGSDFADTLVPVSVYETYLPVVFKTYAR